MSADDLARRREFLKDSVRKQTDFTTTDQSRGLPPPPIEKPPPPGAPRIGLPSFDEFAPLAHVDLLEAVSRRESRRRFSPAPLSLAELALLLWATQGVRRLVSPAVALRTVPSAGARHALETYVCAHRVEGLEVAIYRYLPVEHELVLERLEPGLPARVTAACFGQSFAGEAAATFFWTALPYRMEWRYGAASHKVIALDAGHVCQNLYLCCEAIGAGTCAIGAYDQEACDALLGVDGQEEFTIYVAPVGKKAPGGG
jgi:SagB-type dehydrogenase family enzyme